MSKIVRIIGTGSYVPERIMTNFDLEKLVDTNDEWIRTRTGIRERHIAADDQASSDLGAEAGKRAINAAGIKPDDIDMIIVATITPDMFFPSTACVIQSKLGIKTAAAFDVSAACTGYIYALSVAEKFLLSGAAKKVLVVATETLSKITDWKDRNTCVLLGDGSGASVLTLDDGSRGFLSFYLDADGTYKDLLNMPGGGSRIPASSDSVEQRLHFLKMKGNEVFKVAVHSMVASGQTALNMCGLTCDDVKLIIPHQANTRIIEGVAKRLSIPMDRVFINIHKYGNMSAATTAVGLDEAVREGRIKERDIVELVAFGGGFTWGACVLRW